MSIEHRLERGEIVTWEPGPADLLPGDDDLAFLCQQRVNGAMHKNISYNPDSNTVSGFVQDSQEQAARLQKLLQAFSDRATHWLAQCLPGYAQHWQRDRASLRTEEEATRPLRLTARNDLLHFDAFPSRPTRGHRILRLYVNINSIDDRVWMTSDRFGECLAKYGDQVGLPRDKSVSWSSLLQLFQPKAPERTEYDEFMLRFHHFLKTNEEFQERSKRRLWHFKPRTAWLLFSDAISHAELRGQHALEHSFFIAPQSLVLPDESPLVLLQRRCGTSLLPHVA